MERHPHVNFCLTVAQPFISVSVGGNPATSNFGKSEQSYFQQRVNYIVSIIDYRRVYINLSTGYISFRSNTPLTNLQIIIVRNTDRVFQSRTSVSNTLNLNSPQYQVFSLL